VTEMDAAARARIESDLDTSFVVEAAAGTGKTTALVARIVALLGSGRAEITELAAITFTERAAGELVLRLRDALERGRRDASDPTVRGRLGAALEEFEAAHVGTIHGFCAELLRAHPVDAGVDPSFVVLGDREQQALVEDTAARFLEEALVDPPEGIRRFLRRKRSGQDATPRTVLADAIRSLIERRDAAGSGRRDPFERDAEIDALVTKLRDVAGESAKVATWLRELDRRETVRPRDHDALERGLIELADARASGLSSRAKSPGKGMLEALGRFAARADADLAFCLGLALLPALARYEATKARLGVLDHVDTLVKARALLAERPRAREALAKRFRFLFVDEVQDVDPVQKDVILLLASPAGVLAPKGPDGSAPGARTGGTVAGEPIINAERDPSRVRPRPGSLYLVGDPKQAIYGFRRADIRTYLALRDQLVSAHAERLELTTSYRPRPAIAALVNRAFEPLFDGGHAQAGHVALVAHRPAMKDFPSVIALPSPRVYGDRGPTKAAVESALPRAVARFVAWLLRESGLRVEDPELGVQVPIAPRHIALLFKAVRGNAGPYAAALEAWRIPHAHLGADSFFERETIVAMSAVLAAIEWPDDDLSVYATLKSPFIGITDADLLAYRTRVGHLRPLGAKGDVPKELALVSTVLALLRELHANRHQRSIEATVRAFFEATLAEVSLALDEDGDAEARALSQLVSLARASDVRGESFREFARWIARRVDDPELGNIDPVPDPESVDVVSLLSVHKAKGLEFPVVVLASPMTKPTFWKGPDRWSDPARGVMVGSVGGFRPVELEENLAAAEAYERGEATRVLYVAATRARDVLVVPTGGDTVLDGWTSPLQRALRPEPGMEVSRFDCFPAFGARSSLDSIGESEGVRPGHYAAALGGEGVTFWDPALLEVRAKAAAARNRTHLVEDAATDDGSAAHAAFVAAKKHAIENAAFGAREVRSARSAARQPLGAMLAEDVRLVRLGALDADADSAIGRRLSALLARLVSEPLDTELAKRAAMDGKQMGATEAEVKTALRTLELLRASTELGPMLKTARFGVPFAIASDAGPIVSGRASIVVERADGLVVIGVCVPEPDEAARVELGIAAAAVARASGRSVEAILAWAE
jgi:ATP-dependent helicase/nuclease subunit A